jgi:hypothetical protein
MNDPDPPARLRVATKDGEVEYVRAGEEGAVYRLGEKGSLAVATGAVFVRFREGIRPEERADALAEAGFGVEQTPPYAPHCAWLRPHSGRVGDALTGLEKLRAVPDVEHVEPQMLMKSHRR